MTKQLLTALLIAGLSTTAQAEQWLCKGESANNAVFDLESPVIRPVDFVLTINRQEQSVKLRGDVRAGAINDPSYWGGSVVFGDGYIVRASSWSQAIRLEEDGRFVRTYINDRSSATLVFAKCSQL